MLRVAIVGAGHWGPNLVSTFHDNQRSEVVWVVDTDEARLAQVRQRFPDLSTTPNLDEALRDDTVEAVVIATPTRTHFAITSAALEAGKHVLVEKPLADTLGAAQELAEQATRADRVLMVGHVFVYNVAAQRAKQYVQSGELGRVYYVSMQRTNLGPIRVDVNAAWDLAAHDISLASYWLDSYPLAVSATGGSWINQGIEDTVFATFRYPGDVLVHLHASWLHPVKSRDIAIVGDAKMLTFDDVNATEPIRVYDKQVGHELSHPGFIDSLEDFRMAVRTGDVTIPEVSGPPPLRNECECFLDAVLSGKPTLSGAEEGIEVVRALAALSESLRGGGAEIEVRR